MTRAVEAPPGREADPNTLDKVLRDGTVCQGCRRDLANVGEFLMRGWSVFPLRYRSKVPAIASWTQYQRRQPTLDEVEQWFTGEPRNIAIVTGLVSSLFVIDCDSPHAVAWAEAKLPACEMRVTTAKGLHLYYPYSGDLPIRNKARVRFEGAELEIDVRAEGGYVVGPGSFHPHGHLYARDGRGWS